MPNGQTWSGVLKIAANGAYSLRLVIAASGGWQAKNGQWKITVRAPPPAGQLLDSGPYQFSGRNQVSTTNELGVTHWVRQD